LVAFSSASYGLLFQRPLPRPPRKMSLSPLKCYSRVNIEPHGAGRHKGHPPSDR
jgi:hypothetical protein